MRILVLTNLYPPEVFGGYELACAKVSQELFARGHEVRVLTGWSHLPVPADQPAWVERKLDLSWFVPAETANTTINAFNIHLSVCSSYKNTLTLVDTLRDFSPDVVYVWYTTGLGSAALLDVLNTLKVPWVIHLMDRMPVDISSNIQPEVLGIFNAVGSALYKDAFVITMSKNLLDEIRSIGGIVFPNLEIIPGTADLTHAKEHLPYLRDGVTRFVAAGTISHTKGTDLILQACAELKKRGCNFNVDFYGNGNLIQYISMAKMLQIDDRVTFKGGVGQAELMRHYSEYDVFLFPTWEREPFGFAPVEALGCGSVPIITRNCGVAERLVGNVHCIKITRSANALANAMERVCAGEYDLARMARAGNNLVQTDLSFSRSVDKIERILEGWARPWDREVLKDESLRMLFYLKHNLSISLGFG